MKKIFFLLALLNLSSFLGLKAQISAKVYYISFQPANEILAQPVKEYIQKKTVEPSKEAITIYPNILFQKIAGFGGCFNEIGGEALSSLSVGKQKELMINLFDEVDGCGFSFCRTAIGASDFGLNAYSYSEQPNDYQQNFFSIQRDEKFVLPYIKAALAINSSLQLFASPWSPPAWMKNSLKMTGSEANNTLKDSAQIYHAYAKYFTNYIKAYTKHGVRISRINPQNETDMNATYPSCLMPPQQMAKFINDYLVPEFKRSYIKTEIWAGTYRVYGKFEALELLANKDLTKNIGGIGIQYTKPFYVNQLTNFNPNVKIMHTEGICYNGDNSIAQAQKRFKEITDYLCNGVENYAYWNMILNETGKSAWNWRQNALITINKSTATIKYNPDYAVMYLLSKFVKKGDIRIGHYYNNDIPCIAFKKANGSYLLMLQNDEDKEKSIIVNMYNKKSEIIIPALSLAAVEINN